MIPKESSSLQEKKGVSKPETTNKYAAKKIKIHRGKEISTTTFIKHILQGNISYLSRAITLVESTQEKHQEKANKILEACLPYANKSVRIGITGVPGVGKSTFIETFGKRLTAQGKKVAVLAVDPSSSVYKGSVLGDKTRMELLVTDKNAFIRPSPTGNSLGGVARKTRETILLCEAAGFDTIIIETVGVGQSETAVHAMVDFFLLLKIAGAGDELQGIKRGIIEMADAIVIHKADGDNLKNAKMAKVAFTKALHLYPPKENGWQPKVLTASALKNRGIDSIENLISEYIAFSKKKHFFQSNRDQQNKYWLLANIEETLKEQFYKNPNIKKQLPLEIEKLKIGATTPFYAAEKLLNLLKK